MKPATRRRLKARLARHPWLFQTARGLVRRLRRLVGAVGLQRAFWDRAVSSVESTEPGGWLDWEWVEVEHIRPQISGDRDIDYLRHFQRTHLPDGPAERLLSLGCGGGNLERALLDLGIATTIDAYDASPESIRLARELAEAQGASDRLHYEVADINVLELPENTYDVVVCKMSLHHFEALEHVYTQIRRSLRPRGLFFFNEFVGPTRFQWTDAQLDHMNRLLDELPEPIRRQVPVPRFARPTIQEMLETDPSESVRSAEIMALLENDFEIVEHRPYGGTLLNLLLTEAMHAFDLGDPEHVALLHELSDFERGLIESGELPSDFAYVVARPRIVG